MKSNIDLTENRMFRSNKTIQEWHLNLTIAGGTSHNRFPWVLDTNEDLVKQRDSIIATGNKSERARIQEYRKIESRNYCDCCGDRLNIFPWDNEIGLCRKCNDFYKFEDRKIWWLEKVDIKNPEFMIS